MIVTKEITDFANHLADLSGKIAKKYFRQANEEMAKEDDSPVTKADREIEEMIRAEIMKKFPTHGIIGEEYGIHNQDSEISWIIDPIDGTSSFIIGRPIFGTLIALAYRGKVVLGIMNQPITEERWLGIAGKDSQFNGKKIKTRNCTEISQAVLCACSPFFFKDEAKISIDKIASQTRYQHFGGIVYGGDCYLYAMLASGFVDLIIEPGLKVYDYAALIPIIEMAGGVITDWEGKDLGLESGVKVIAASTKELHQKALKIINS